MYRQLVALSHSRHGAVRLLAPSSYAFAALEVLVPVAVGEVSQAAGYYPVPLVRDGDALRLAVLLGLGGARNACVAQDGHWRCSYVPNLIRAYPFAVVRPSPGAEPIVCVDEGSGLLTEDRGAPLFVEGQPSAVLSKRLELLQAHENGIQSVARACSVLRELDVVAPWEVKVVSEEGERSLAGLFRVDEQRLLALDDRAFLAIRRSGALVLAYAHLLSQVHLADIGRLSTEAAGPPPSEAPPPAPLSGLLDDGLLRFE